MLLKDFKEDTHGSSLKDFEVEEEQRSRLILSNNNTALLAAQEAILSGNASEESYRTIKDSLQDPVQREKFVLEQVARRDMLFQDATQEIPNLLLDAEIDDETKRGVLEGFSPEGMTNSTIKTLLEQSVVKEVVEEESEGEYLSKINLSGRIEQINQQKRDFAARINAIAAERDSSVVSKAVDLAELLVPFSEWVNVTQLSRELSDSEGWLAGGKKEALFKAVQKVPVEDRPEFFDKVVDYLNSHGDVLFPDGNDLVILDTLEKMFVNNDYSNTEKWADNIFSILDVAGVFAVLGSAGRAARAAKKASTASGVKPGSAADVVKEGDTQAARELHEAVAQSEGDEAAQALYGTTKPDAMGNDLLPSPEVKEGTMPHKAQQAPVPAFDEPDIIRDTRRIDASSALTDTELARIQERTRLSLNDIEGMTPHPNSMTIKTNTEDGSTLYTMMYRPEKSGLSSYDEAMDNALYAFRDYGLVEDNIKIYARQGTEWVETTREEQEAFRLIREKARAQKKRIPDEAKETEYAVGIEYNYRFSPDDLTEAEVLDGGKIFGLIPKNLFSRLQVLDGRSGEGSFTQHILDPNSLFNKRIVESAAAATDRTYSLQKMYIDQFEGFIKGYEKLSAKRRDKMVGYINKANAEGIKFNETSLRAQGFSDTEIDLLRQWRRGNDILYHSTNADMVKTLKNKGYKLYVDKATDTKLVGKPIPRRSISSGKSYYDLKTGTKQPAAKTKEELDEFYEKGGTFVRLKEPIEVDGEWINIIKSSETSDGGYLRAFNDNDKVLHYREGYYPVLYDANFYIQQKFRVDGEDVVKTIASARTRDSAERYVAKLKEQHDGENISFEYVTDARLLRSNTSEAVTEEGYHVAVASGLSAQKVRGKRLTDVESDLWKGEYSNLVDPMDAVAAQIQQLSARTSMRDWLETTKRRWNQNYGAKLGFSEDNFPANVSQIEKNTDITWQELADARDLYNYVRSMENGYINTLDDSLKGVMNMFATMAGKFDKRAEAAIRELSKNNPSGEARGAAFKLYLASAPARQLLIQGHQAVQLQAIAPKYFWAGLGPDLMRIGQVMRGSKADPEAMEMWKELQRSGFLQAVDSNTLVRKDMLQLANATWARKGAAAAGLPLKWSQRIGFDTAEQFVLVTSWLTMRNKAIKAGKTLDRRTYDEIAGEARAFTYNMNRSGEMPYNRNSGSVIAQFLSVPQKAFLQPFFNTSLTRRERAQLLAWNTTVYGVPTGTFLHTWVNENVKDDTTREIFTRGMEQLILNEALTRVSGNEQAIDWGDLAPTNITAVGDLFVTIATGDLGALITESPSASLLFGANPRISDAFKTGLKYFNLRDDYDDPTLDTRFSDVASAAANLFSGYSHAFRMNYAYKVGEKRNTLGNITDSDVTKLEAVAQAFGLRTLDEAARFEINKKLREAEKKASGMEMRQAPFTKNDVRSWYTELKRQLNRRGVDERQQDMSARILTEGMRVFSENPPRFRRSLLNMIEADAKRGEYDFVKGIMRAMNWMDESELRGIVNMVPEDKLRRQLTELIDGVHDG